MIRFLRYPLAASMLALILSYWLAGGQARGQTTGTATSTSTPVPATPTPTATATATPSIPSGQDLFARMTAAIVAKNTYHLTLHLTEAVPSSLRVVISSQADFSNKPRMERVVETT